MTIYETKTQTGEAVLRYILFANKKKDEINK